MDPKRLTGPNAGSTKYDLITALSVMGLSGKPVLQTSMTRLIALVTARYNWLRDEVTVGQRDLAKMWSVDERTVKREMKRMVGSNILIKLRPGVRGRVAAYRLNYREIVLQSQPSWGKVGPDFKERMSGIYPQSEVKVVKVDFVTKEIENKTSSKDSEQRTGWRQVRQKLRGDDLGTFQNWYDKLIFQSCCDGTLVLQAPNKFFGRYVETHLSKPLLAAAEHTFPDVRYLRIEVSIGSK